MKLGQLPPNYCRNRVEILKVKNKGDILISSLTKYEAIQELNRLAGEIQVHDLAYHRDDNPIISDSEYDGLRRRANEIFGRFPNLKRDRQSWC